MKSEIYIHQSLVDDDLLITLRGFVVQQFEDLDFADDHFKGSSKILVTQDVNVAVASIELVPCILVSDQSIPHASFPHGALQISESMLRDLDEAGWQVVVDNARRLWEIERELRDRQTLASSSAIRFIVIDKHLAVVHDSANTNVSAINSKTLRDFVPEESLAELTYFLSSPADEGTQTFVSSVLSSQDSGSIVSASITVGETLLDDGTLGTAIYIKEMPERETSNLDQRQYQTLFNSLSEAIVVLDTDSKLFFDVNTAACELFNLSKKELLELGPIQLSPRIQPTGKASIEAAGEQIQRAMEGGKPIFPWMHVNKDGEEILCQVHLVKYPSATHNLVAGFLIDKSREAEYERKLKIRDARLQAVLNNTSAGVSIKNQQGVYEYINPTFEQFVGVRTERVIGKTASELLPREVANSIDSQDRIVWESGQRHESTEVLEFDGVQRVFMLSKFLLDDPNGENFGLCTIATEITEKARTERALSESLQTFAGVLEAIPSAIFIYTFDENSGLFLTNVNPAAKKLFAGETLLKMGYEFREVWPADVSVGLYSTLLNIVRLGGIHTTKSMQFQTVNGDTKFVSLRVFSIPGQRLGIAVDDVTEATLAEYSRKNVHRDLESRVQERTAELKALNHELESFSYSVSHDLRAPIRAVAGFSGMLREDYGSVLDTDGLRLLDMVQESAAKMNVLVDSLLQLSRISSVELYRQEIDISEMAQNILSRLQELDADRNVRVEIQPGLRVFADVKLTLVLMDNLLSNAWKYTSQADEQSIFVSGFEEDEHQWIEIRDTGAGFDMKYAERLFTVFQRLHSAEEFAGDGVGLATVQRVVNRHRGSIKATSELGHGATFTFHL